MPTNVHFSGDERPILIKEDYERVSEQFSENRAGQFNLHDRPGIRVSIYRSGVAYIEEVRSGESAKSEPGGVVYTDQ